MAGYPYRSGIIAVISQVLGAWDALRLGRFRVGLGGYAPLPTIRNRTGSQGIPDPLTGK